MLKILCLALGFFSLAQPALLFPSLGEDNIFFIIAATTGYFYFLQRMAGGESWRIPQSKYIYGMMVAYILSEAQYLWLGGTITVFLFWVKKVLLYYLIVNILKDQMDLKRIIWSVLFGLGVLMWVGWKEFLNAPPMTIYSDRLCSLGNYNNANSFALVLTLSFPLAFALMEVEKDIFKRAILFLFLGVSVVSCAYTKSRGGMLGMLIAVIMSVSMSRRSVKSKRTKVVLVSGMILLFVGYGIALVLSRSDVESFTGAGGEASAGDRLMAWVAGIKMFIDHPLVGVGWGKFKEYALDYGMDRRMIAHNTPISILAETGLVGIFFFLGILFHSFRELWTIKKDLDIRENEMELLILANGVFISLLCFLINTSFSVKDHDPMYWNLLALTGVVYAVYMRGKKSGTDKAFETTINE
jgi:O-antigen ligase